MPANGREIPHSQMSVLFMAIYFKRMTEDETFGMVEAINNSGATLDFSNSKNNMANKHSTGGIGYKVSPILGSI